MGFYGVLPKENILESFDVELENFSKLVDSFDVLYENGIILEADEETEDTEKDSTGSKFGTKIKEFITKFVDWAKTIFDKLYVTVFNNKIIAKTEELIKKHVEVPKGVAIFTFDKKESNIETVNYIDFNTNLVTRLKKIIIADKVDFGKLANENIENYNNIISEQNKIKEFLSKCDFSSNYVDNKQLNSSDLNFAATQKELIGYINANKMAVENTKNLVKEVTNKLRNNKSESIIVAKIAKNDISLLKTTISYLYRSTAFILRLITYNNNALKVKHYEGNEEEKES